jgi:hypothetical protein
LIPCLAAGTVTGWIVYTYMLNRWWRATLAIGLVLLALAGGLGGLPLLLPQYPFMWVDDWKLWVVGGAGGFAILMTIFLAAIRKSAYVQPFETHLRLVTPFLRLNISYRRFRRTYTAEMHELFPANKVKGQRREIVRPLAGRTVLVIEMNSFPVSGAALRLFLSPLFFPDKTPRLALLVSDWMSFSTEMESLRSTWQDSLRQPPGNRTSGLFPDQSQP